MKTIGMSAGMWLLFAGSFRKQLSETLGCDAVRAREIAAEAKRDSKGIFALSGDAFSAIHLMHFS